MNDLSHRIEPQRFDAARQHADALRREAIAGAADRALQRLRGLAHLRPFDHRPEPGSVREGTSPSARRSAAG